MDTLLYKIPKVSSLLACSAYIAAILAPTAAAASVDCCRRAVVQHAPGRPRLVERCRPPESPQDQWLQPIHRPHYRKGSHMSRLPEDPIVIRFPLRRALAHRIHPQLHLFPPSCLQQFEEPTILPIRLPDCQLSRQTPSQPPENSSNVHH